MAVMAVMLPLLGGYLTGEDPYLIRILNNPV